MRRLILIFSFPALLFTFNSGRSLLAAEPEPIRYTLSFPTPASHYVEVEAVFPSEGAGDLTLMIPVWTPGSYLVREYARNIEGVVAQGPDGMRLASEKTRKNRWRVKPDGAKSVKFSYKVYAREMGVQTSWIDEGFALLNGAGTFVTIAEKQPRRHEVTVVLPAGWKGSYTGLPDAPDHQPNHYVAPDFDTLVDSPIYVGSPAVYEFTVDGKKHYLVNEGEGGIWDGPTSAKDVEKIVKAQRDLWGFLPYDKYLFLNMLVEAGGGLEHKNSTVLMSSRFATRTHKTYLNWLELVSHEFFHPWNVKRLRPVELGPFDYENEVNTKSLWLAEGVTDYYGRLLVRRAGLCTEVEYLNGRTRGGGGAGADDPSGDIARLQTTEGRLVQPLESSSFDTWIKFYRPDENSANTAISYYTKGAVVGFLLDAKIRAATDNKKSLDDVMRLAYQRYSGEKGYTPQEFRATAQEVAGIDLSGWFHKVLETTEELDYSEALAWFGLQFKSGKPEKDKTKDTDPPKAWTGLVTKVDGGRLLVSQVKRSTPGFTAGFNVNDEILAINEDRVRPEGWGAKMDVYRPGDKVSVLIARRDRLMRLETVFAEEPPKPWILDPSPKADDAQKARRKAWLGN